MAARLSPLPPGGDHGLDTFSGHVLRRNRAPALIAEPVFLTNAYPTTTLISVTQRITTTLARVAARQLRLTNVTLSIARTIPAAAKRGRAPSLLAGMHVVRLAHLLPAAPQSHVADETTRAPGGDTPQPGPTALGGTSATLAPTGTLLLPARLVPSGFAVITVTGDISVTTRVPAWFGDGPWLLEAHTHTVQANPDYNAPMLPTRLSSARYPYDDREEQIARALLQGVAQFFGHRHLLPAPVALRLSRADPVVAVATGAPARAAPTPSAGR
jgi:hypothetical protein